MVHVNIYIKNLSVYIYITEWISHDENYYLLSKNTESLDASGARTYCRDRGGDLLSINDQEEQNFINSQIRYYFILVKIHISVNNDDFRKSFIIL